VVLFSYLPYPAGSFLMGATLRGLQVEGGERLRGSSIEGRERPIELQRQIRRFFGKLFGESFAFQA
jgi:hypothetical protein